MTTDIAIRDSGAAIAEQVIVKGDLAKLSEAERMAYYGEVCRSLGLNPLTRPFEYITLNGKLTLYATRGAGDQLRASRGISITGLTASQVGDLYVVVATGRDRDGREDSATGAVAIKGLSGEPLANAMMKAETKSKRRLTLSLAGLGWPDESEVESIATASVEPVARQTLAERAAAKAAEIVADDTSESVVDEVVVEAETPAAPAELTKAEFNRLAVGGRATKGDVAASGRRLGLPEALEDWSDADRHVVAVDLGLL